MSWFFTNFWSCFLWFVSSFFIFFKYCFIIRENNLFYFYFTNLPLCKERHSPPIHFLPMHPLPLDGINCCCCCGGGGGGIRRHSNPLPPPPAWTVTNDRQRVTGLLVLHMQRHPFVYPPLQRALFIRSLCLSAARGPIQPLCGAVTAFSSSLRRMCISFFFFFGKKRLSFILCVCQGRSRV